MKHECPLCHTEHENSQELAKHISKKHAETLPLRNIGPNHRKRTAS